MLTSKYIMSKSFRAFNQMFAYSKMDSIPKVCDMLASTEQAITFKDLGVISTSETDIWRPRTTRLFNFIKSLVELDFEAKGQETNHVGQSLAFSESYQHEPNISQTLVFSEMNLIGTTKEMAKDNSLLIDVLPFKVYGSMSYIHPSHSVPSKLTHKDANDNGWIKPSGPHKNKLIGDILSPRSSEFNIRHFDEYVRCVESSPVTPIY